MMCCEYGVTHTMTPVIPDTSSMITTKEHTTPAIIGAMLDPMVEVMMTGVILAFLSSKGIISDTPFLALTDTLYSTPDTKSIQTTTTSTTLITCIHTHLLPFTVATVVS